MVSLENFTDPRFFRGSDKIMTIFSGRERLFGNNRQH